MTDFDLSTWRETYREKEIVSKDIIKMIAPGSRIYIGSGCSEPTTMTNELVQSDPQNLSDCQILHYFTLSDQKFFNEKNPTLFRHNSLSIIGSQQMSDAIKSGKSDYTPIMSSEIPRMLQRHRFKVDVALLQVSPPDANGYCSLGINVDLNRAIIKVAKCVVAQINP